MVTLIAILAASTRQGLRLPCPYTTPVVDVPPGKAPTPSPLEGPYAPNTVLTGARRLWVGAEKPGAGGTAQGRGDGRAAGSGQPPTSTCLRLIGSAPSSSQTFLTCHNLT